MGVHRYRDGRSNVIYNHGYGFGYDSVSHDYKVVQIVQSFKQEVNSLHSLLVSYGVRSNSSIDIEFPYIIVGRRQTGVFVGGAIHWTVVMQEDLDGEGPEIVIVGFDLGLNELREVPQPDYRDGDSLTIVIGELGKCLCIFANYKDKFVDVWMMKEYGVKESWSILFTVPHPGLCYNDNEIRPMGFSATGQEVLLQLDNKKLVWYDLKDPKKVAAAEEITIHGLKRDNVDAIVCFGSLVSPYDKSPLTKEEVKVEKPQHKPRLQRKKRDDFLSAGFKLKL